MLWVEISNIKAINIYKYYGYNYDNLTDLIMTKGVVQMRDINIILKEIRPEFF